MRILVCIDDTDNLESQGTGELASSLAAGIEASGWGQSSYVTRHQLLIHPDIPYTSHNSAMAFTAEVKPDCLEQITMHAAEFLASTSAEGSDPGLCIVDLDALSLAGELLDFGCQAKKRVLTKDDAYALAEKLTIHLSEHGGTGQGVVGALAGAGLRLGGNDGRLKGRLKLIEPQGRLTVAQLLEHPTVEVVRCEDGTVPVADELVQLDEKVKTVLLGGQSVLLVERTEDGWCNLSRRKLKSY